MRTPTEYEIENLLHYAVGYDPVAAKKYYEEHKHLKGRKKGQGDRITEDDPRWNPKTMGNRRGSIDPRRGKTREQIARDARTRQRKELSDSINALSDRLNKLEALIKKREAEEKSTDRKSKAKKERAAKEKDKPKTAAEKAKAARESEKYRDQHKQELKNKSGDKKSGGSSSGSKKKAGGKHSVSELRSLATKVRGQIAVAKQKLAAL
jgi:hypothetical protein